MANDFFDVIETYECEEAGSEAGDLLCQTFPEMADRFHLFEEYLSETPIYELYLVGELNSLEDEASRARSFLRNFREA